MSVGVQEELRDSALQDLVDVVKALCSDGRPGVAASSLKPALQARRPGFSERQLGFSGFGAFLRWVESKGAVVLHQVANSGPIDVSLPSPDALPGFGIEDDGFYDRPKQRQRSNTPRLRQDLWEAFVNWSGGAIRVFDKHTGRAFKFSESPSTGESEVTRSLRRSLSREPDRFVRIEPISREKTLKWMLDFTAGLDDTRKRQVLMDALREPLPMHRFSDAVREQGIGGTWHDYRGRLVRAEVEGWASKHDLDIDWLFRATFEGDAAQPAPVLVSSELERLREQVHKAVERMSLSELLELRLPLSAMVVG